LLQNGILHFIFKLSQSSEIALGSLNLKQTKTRLFWTGLVT